VTLSGNPWLRCSTRATWTALKLPLQRRRAREGRRCRRIDLTLVLNGLILFVGQQILAGETEPSDFVVPSLQQAHRLVAGYGSIVGRGRSRVTVDPASESDSLRKSGPTAA
jgi:hypothetical protein